MYPSAALCREQEAFQHERAISAPLENVRTIAQRAAAAWGVEAILAEKREYRKEATRKISAGLVEQQQRRREENDRSFSENPDRSFASAASLSPASTHFSETRTQA